MQDAQRRGVAPRYTLVSFHAHPDDEVLYTGGTLARAAAEGHRVVVVVATSGEAGLTGDDRRDDLGQIRLQELEASAAALGVSRVECLGYADSGSDAAATLRSGAFAAVPVEQAARRVATLLREERADVITIYDAHGGYGHRDHRHVHTVGRRAAELAGTPVVLEATLPRETLQRALRVLAALRLRPGGTTAAQFDASYRSRREITHVVPVRRYAARKRAALAAHASQAVGGSDVRTVDFMLRLPMPIFRRVFGTEWYAEVGRAVPHRPYADVFATVPAAGHAAGVPS